MSRKSPAPKPVALSPAPKKRRGCLGRLFVGAATLMGLFLLFGVVMGVIQGVGQSIGVLPTRAPTPTHTVTPTYTPSPGETPTVIAQARAVVVDAAALDQLDPTTETPAVLPTETLTPAPIDTTQPADTPTPMSTPTIPPTNTRAPTPTKTVTPTRTPTTKPTDTATPAPTPMPTAAPTDTPTAAPVTAPVASGNANLRAGPGTDYAVIGGVVAGQALEISGVSGNGQWYQLASGMWISAQLVNGAPPASTLPVVAAPPLPTVALSSTPVPQRSEPVTVAQPTSAPAGGGSAGSQWPAYTCTDNPVPPPDPNCPIKGNISDNGHIYHMPGQRDYCRTVIRVEDGERWFCSAAEAEAAGWRAAQR